LFRSTEVAVRRAANVDANQKVIVRALRGIGAGVQLLHRVGEGCPDLLVGFRASNHLLEVKTKDGELEDTQVRWIAGWPAPVYVVRTVEEAFRAIGAIR
jgi:hypothetical protein